MFHPKTWKAVFEQNVLYYFAIFKAEDTTK